MQLRLENAYFLSFWGTFPLNDVTHRPNPKKDHPWADPRHLSHKPRKSVARFELGVWTRKKGQDRTGQEKKSQKSYISPICGEAPTKAIYMKICVVGVVVPHPCYITLSNTDILADVSNTSDHFAIHRLRGSASPVLTATGFVNGKGQFSTPINRQPSNNHQFQVITLVTPTAVIN